MTLIIRLIAKYALWIYVLCGLGMLAYLRAALAARREGADAIFSLEKETAAHQIYRSSGMIMLLLLIAVGVYALANYVEPPQPSASPISTPPAVNQTSTPTRRASVGAQGTPTLTPEPTFTRRPRQTIVELPTIVMETPTVAPPAAPASCPHPNVQVVQPEQNQIIDAGIDVIGTATKELFDRYEFKFQSRDFADEWHWVETFRTPVENGTLGFWQTSHLPAGNYAFMLIAIDKTGNSQECVVPVTIQH